MREFISCEYDAVRNGNNRACDALLRVGCLPSKIPGKAHEQGVCLCQ
jgi:hypothetical protein